MIFKPFIVAATLIALSTLIGGCYSYQGNDHLLTLSTDTNPPESTTRNIVFTPAGWSQPLAGDLYLPQASGLRPVVLMIHGGGWSSRNRDDMDSVSMKLARHGYAVFNVSYRFAPEYIFPAQYQDLQQALGWIAAHADEFRFDLGRVNTWGYSSGAHLAALLASADADSLGLTATPESLPSIRAVVAGGTPADLRKYSGSPIVVPFLGGDRDEIPKVYAQASPVFHISADDPPVFLYHGKLDQLVEKEQASDYYQALREAGIESELYLHRFWGHFTMFLFGGGAEDRAIDFLNRNNT